MLSRFYFHFRHGKCNDKSQMIQFLVFLSNRDPPTIRSGPRISKIFGPVPIRFEIFILFILVRTGFGPWIPNCCTNRSDKGFKLNSAHLLAKNSYIFRGKFPKIKFFGFVWDPDYFEYICRVSQPQPIDHNPLFPTPRRDSECNIAQFWGFLSLGVTFTLRKALFLWFHIWSFWTDESLWSYDND